MGRKLFLLLFTLQISLANMPAYAAANHGDDETPQAAPNVAVFQYTAHPKESAHSPIKEVDVTAIEVTDPLVVEAAIETAVAGRSVEALTIITPDDEKAIAPEVAQAVEVAANLVVAPVKQKVKMSTKLFDWFQRSQFRLTIIAFEVTTITGLKYLELTIGPEPVHHSVAFACGILMGATMGAIEWNSPKLMALIKNTSTPIKWVLGHITKMAKASETGKLRATLDGVWQFMKNASLNYAVFSLFKVILFATTQDATSLAEVAHDAAHAFSNSNLLDSAELALGATAVSFPTTKVILAYMGRKIAKANAQTELSEKTKVLLEMKDMVTFFLSSALTARALLFSSLMIASTFDWPQLKLTAIGGLATMFVGSIWKLIYDNRKAKEVASCADQLKPSALNSEK